MRAATDTAGKETTASKISPLTKRKVRYAGCDIAFARRGAAELFKTVAPCLPGDDDPLFMHLNSLTKHLTVSPIIFTGGISFSPLHLFP
jgi:hypothetical protein